MRGYGSSTSGSPHYQDNLLVHHDVVYAGKNYKDVLKTCADFLARNPSETIIMLVKDEERFDSSLDDFAPSELAGRLSRREFESWDNTRSFEDELAGQTREQLGTTPLFYNFATSPSGDLPATTLLAFTPLTTLGDVRGKIVLLRRFQSDRDIGLDVTYWLDNTTMRSSADEDGNARITVSLIYNIEDHYKDPGQQV